jgi:glycine/D-amino acid oxidase-like deaminating enzyme
MAIGTQQASGAVVKLRLASLARFDPLIAELEALLNRSIPVNRSGLLRLIAAEEWEKWQPTLKARREAGYNLQELDARTIESLLPGLRAQAGLYSPGDRQIEPRVFAHALVQAARQQGAQFCWHAPVQQLRVDGHRITAIDTPNETIAADTFVLTAGVGSECLGEKLGLNLPIVPVKGQALRVRASDISFGPVVTDGECNLVPLSDGSCWIGATVEFHPLSSEPTLGGLQTLLQQAIALYPALAGAELLESWAGYRPRPTGQRAPILGRSPLHDNLIVATGHYRNGILLAPITAQVVRDLAVEGQTSLCHLADFAPRT